MNHGKNAVLAARRQLQLDAENRLREMGAVLEKREDRFGETKSGWWMDGVYLGPKSDPRHALRVLEGN